MVWKSWDDFTMHSYVCTRVYMLNCVCGYECIIFWGWGGWMFTACCMCMCTPQRNISIHSCPVNNMCALFVCVHKLVHAWALSLSVTTTRPGLWTSTGDQTCAPRDTCTKALCDTHSTFTEASAGFFLEILGGPSRVCRHECVCVCCGLNVQLWPLWVNLNLPLSYLPTPTVDFKVNNLNSLSNRGISSSITNKSKFEL